ncbi:SoxR reducing system RseC family protein [bacterium]|nr:SoxR reducing system RseC family protein [bacterium]
MIKMANGSTFGKGTPPGTEIGVVMEVDGDTARIKPQSSAVCDTCGSSSVCFPSEGESPLIEARNEVGATVGDLVSIERGEAQRIGASLVLFGLPVATTVGGTLLGSSSTQDVTGGAATGAIAGLALGMLLISLINKIVAQRSGLNPVAKSILGRTEVVEHGSQPPLPGTP